MQVHGFATGFLGTIMLCSLAAADDFLLTLRDQQKNPDKDTFQRIERKEMWKATETAVVVCDVWDKHHSLNAVRRMEEFVPRMNDLLAAARMRGAIIIHAPSDCMEAYADHPARRRALMVPQAAKLPDGVEFWCSKIPTEELASYPIDQSDGGDDDDPQEHAVWAAELKALGRNPALPWKKQHPGITIDPVRDYISDRGDEVWSILESQGIQNIMLVGVHTNMCVLGRPFGLRQMVRHGKNAVLVRDLTDCMYNPKQWPYVDHFTGNDLVVSHIERFVCPTMTSDQILGGQPFVSKFDTRTARDQTEQPSLDLTPDLLTKQWTTIHPWSSAKEKSKTVISQHSGPVWLRCSVRLPSDWIGSDSVTLSVASSSEVKIWVNGTELPLKRDERTQSGELNRSVFPADDVNLIVMRIHQDSSSDEFPAPLKIRAGDRKLSLSGRWQIRFGDDASWSNLPLPAKFGLGSDVLFEPESVKPER
jgi:nicotinamidase-related amidase